MAIRICMRPLHSNLLWNLRTCGASTHESAVISKYVVDTEHNFG